MVWYLIAAAIALWLHRDEFAKVIHRGGEGVAGGGGDEPQAVQAVDTG